MGLTLMNMLGLSSRIRISLIACYGKFFLLHYIQVLCHSRFCKAYHAYLTYLMLQRQLSHLNGPKPDRSSPLYSLGANRMENTTSNSSSIVTCISVTAIVFTEPFPSSAQFLLAPLFWPFSCHVTVFYG
jgi:hypothetical protein